jgi:hypothetical protein
MILIPQEGEFPIRLLPVNSQRVIPGSPDAYAKKKRPQYSRTGAFLHEEPGSDLLWHGLQPHYHRRRAFSLPSSEWDRVVPARYGRQANRKTLCMTLVAFANAWDLRP